MTAARKTAAVIGGGPAGLMAAEGLAAGGVAVTVYDRMPSLGRKLLMAGRGGLNLTHGEPLPAFLARYGAAESHLREAVAAFPPDRLRRWCEDLGQPTFVGSSGRVFPTALKASPLLRAWLRRLAELGVQSRTRHRWTGWNPDGALVFAGPDGSATARPDVTVLALGGASWPNLGSDGRWAGVLAAAGLPLVPFQPANSGFAVPWSPHFRDRFAGEPLKNIAIRFGSAVARGDAVVTRTGLEGGPVYALSAALRDSILATGEARISLALRPDLEAGDLTRKLAARLPKQSLASFLRTRLRLAPVGVGLLNESALLAAGPALSSLPPDRLAALINAVPVRLDGVASIDRAISTAGGLGFSALDVGFMAESRPGLFVAGEMLDWEAPTGGYLLQACFATGFAAGQGALGWLHGGDPGPNPTAPPDVRASEGL